jgi:hypothetical protein
MTGTFHKLTWLMIAAATLASGGRVCAEVFVEEPVVQTADIGRAAVDSAVAQVIAQVSGLPLTPGLTVGGFLDATGGRGLLAEKISAAPRPGGVRQLGPQTSQVRVDVSGEFLLAALAEVARERAGRSPIPAELIETQGAALLGRRFVATGTVTTPAAAMNLSGASAGDGAVGTGSAATPEQIERARVRAVETTVARLREAGVLPVANAESAAASARNYLSTCPVSRIAVDGQGQVVVELSIVADELIAAIRGGGDASARAGDARLSDTEMRDAVQRAAVPSVATKSVTRGGEAVGQVMLAPPWAEDAFAATVRHKEKLSRLALVRAAERKAAAELRGQILARLSADGALPGGLRADDGTLDGVMDRAMAGARTVSVDFVSADEVVVVMSLHGRQVWEEVRKVAAAGR